MAQLDLNVRISDYIEFEVGKDYRSVDFTVACNPSLKVNDKYSLRGKKESVEYTDRKTEDLVVRKTIVEKYEDKEIHIVFEWYDREGSVSTTKTKIIDYSETQWQSRFRDQRERIMDDLKGRAKKYNSEQYVDILYAYFKDEKLDFVETGSLMFANAVQETLGIDISNLPSSQQQAVGTVQQILNTSLDGVNKVYETLIFLTTLPDD